MADWTVRVGQHRSVWGSGKGDLENPLFSLDSLLQDNRTSKGCYSVHGNWQTYSRLDESSIVGLSTNVLIEDNKNLEHTDLGKLLKEQRKKYDQALLPLINTYNSYKTHTEKKISQLKQEISDAKYTQETELEKFKIEIVRALRSEIAQVKAELKGKNSTQNKVNQSLVYADLVRENKQLRERLTALWRDYGRNKLNIDV